MATGFGVDPKSDGTSGTSSADIRKIFGGIYTPGIISGATVTTSGSAMQYTVSSGVVSIRPSSGESILAPVAAATINTAAAPATGTRTDTIYAQQRYATIEGDANVIVDVTSGALPARSIVLKKYIVSAGQTNTNAAVRTGGVDYSIPYGASLGGLHYAKYTAMGMGGNLPNSLTRVCSGSFYLPTDRRVIFKVRAVISARDAVGFDNSKYCEYGFLPNIDGGDILIFSTTGLHQAVQNTYFECEMDVLAGTHTTNLGMLRMVGPGTARGWQGTDALGFGRNGIEFSVEDLGPVK